MLSKPVKIIVDRPLGCHHPKHDDLVYPINYGYVEGVFAADGEEQDVYILGVDKPVASFTGRVIAIVHRRDDVEEKWVGAPDGMTFTEEEIAFVEQFCKERNAEFALCEVWSKGGEGGIPLAQKVIETIENKKSNYKLGWLQLTNLAPSHNPHKNNYKYI